MSDINAVTYTRMVEITPSDTTAQFSDPAAGFGCDVAGTIKFRMPGGKETHTRTVLAGVLYPWAVVQIYAAGTTATGIYAVVDPALYRGWT